MNAGDKITKIAGIKTTTIQNSVLSCEGPIFTGGLKESGEFGPVC